MTLSVKIPVLGIEILRMELTEDAAKAVPAPEIPVVAKAAKWMSKHWVKAMIR